MRHGQGLGQGSNEDTTQNTSSSSSSSSSSSKNSKKRKSLSTPSGYADNTYDLRYADGAIEKRVPRGWFAKPRRATGGEGEGTHGLRCTHPIFVPLIKPGLPDPALSVLPLGSCLGACSESLQHAMTEFAKNTQATSNDVYGGAVSEEMSDTQVGQLLCQTSVVIPYRCILNQSNLSIHPINTPYQYTLSTHPINPSYQYTLSTHPIITPYQPILSTPSQHTLSTHPIITPYQPSLSPRISSHPPLSSGDIHCSGTLGMDQIHAFSSCTRGGRWLCSSSKCG